MRHSPAEYKTLPGTKLQHIQAVSVIIFATTAVAMSPVYILQTPATWIARAGVVFHLIMYGSPLSALGAVLQQRSAKTIPLPVAVSRVVSCGVSQVCLK
jgi:hypothetical protein